MIKKKFKKILEEYRKNMTAEEDSMEDLFILGTALIPKKNETLKSYRKRKGEFTKLPNLVMSYYGAVTIKD